MPDKLTDNEIKQAVKKCIIDKKCKNCMFEDESGCSKGLLYLAYNLINRLQGENKAFAEIIKKQDDEISGLRKDLLSRKNLEESFSKSVKQFDKKLARTVELTKAEAYKECIEKVKEKSQVEIYCDNQLPEPITTYHITEDTLVKLLKELVGDE